MNLGVPDTVLSTLAQAMTGTAAAASAMWGTSEEHLCGCDQWCTSAAEKHRAPGKAWSKWWTCYQGKKDCIHEHIGYTLEDKEGI